MNKRIFIYYMAIMALFIGAYKFHSHIKASNVLALSGFNCVVEGRCPEKWYDLSKEDISFQKFRTLLQVGHQLNASLSYSLIEDNLSLVQTFKDSCGNFQVSYTMHVKNDKFYLIDTDGLEKLNFYFQKIQQ